MEWKMCGRPVKSTGIYKTLLWCNLVQDFFFFFFFPLSGCLIHLLSPVVSLALSSVLWLCGNDTCRCIEK